MISKNKTIILLGIFSLILGMGCSSNSQFNTADSIDETVTDNVSETTETSSDSEDSSTSTSSAVVLPSEILALSKEQQEAYLSIAEDVRDKLPWGTDYVFVVNQTICTDADGDSFCEEEDCDDDDKSINPNGTETDGDGVDSNCDGFDESSPDLENADQDEDGYTVAQGDCDDTDADVNPGEVENYFIGNNGGNGHQDYKDNDCDGKIDETDCSCAFLNGYANEEGDDQDDEAKYMDFSTEELALQDKDDETVSSTDFSVYLKRFLQNGSYSAKTKIMEKFGSKSNFSKASILKKILLDEDLTTSAYYAYRMTTCTESLDKYKELDAFDCVVSSTETSEETSDDSEQFELVIDNIISSINKINIKKFESTSQTTSETEEEEEEEEEEESYIDSTNFNNLYAFKSRDTLGTKRKTVADSLSDSDAVSSTDSIDSNEEELDSDEESEADSSDDVSSDSDSGSTDRPAKKISNHDGSRKWFEKLFDREDAEDKDASEDEDDEESDSSSDDDSSEEDVTSETDTSSEDSDSDEYSSDTSSSDTTETVTEDSSETETTSSLTSFNLTEITELENPCNPMTSHVYPIVFVSETTGLIGCGGASGYYSTGYAGEGLYVTKDGGISWTKVSDDTTGEPGISQMKVYDIFVEDEDTVLVSGLNNSTEEYISCTYSNGSTRTTSNRVFIYRYKISTNTLERVMDGNKYCLTSPTIQSVAKIGDKIIGDSDGGMEIYFSNDGGETWGVTEVWEEENFGGDRHAYQIQDLKVGNGNFYAVGSTNTNGPNFFKPSTHSSADYYNFKKVLMDETTTALTYNIFTYDDGNTWLSGLWGRNETDSSRILYKSTDGGETWTASTVSVTDSTYDVDWNSGIACHSGGVVCIATARKSNVSTSSGMHIGGYLLYSEDGGSSWNEFTIDGFDMSANDILCQPVFKGEKFWAACSDGIIYHGDLSETDSSSE